MNEGTSGMCVVKCVWGVDICWGTVCIDVGGGKESYSLLSLNTGTTDIVAIVLHFGALWAAPGWRLLGLHQLCQLHPSNVSSSFPSVS
jgi:hypothetical protein